MTATAKVSVAIGRDELAWAKTLARREGKSLSAVVTESLAERRRLEALADVVEWMGEGQPPLTAAELRGAQRALGARPEKRAGGAARSKKVSARRKTSSVRSR